MALPSGNAGNGPALEAVGGRGFLALADSMRHAAINAGPG